jgi:RHS repeat-associated protein
MNQQRVATDITINYDPSSKGGGQQEQLSAKGTSSSETAWSPALTDFNEVLVGLGQKPLDTASLELPTLAAYFPETVTAKSSNSQAESASTTTRILFWYHPDYLGNVDLITEIDGFAHEFFMYNPWGEEMHQWNANTYAFTSPYRFNAKELDPETGLAYYGARYYQNKLGVWLSVDPLAHKNLSLSPFNFSGNNTNYFVDPNGKEIIITGTGAKEFVGALDQSTRLKVTYDEQSGKVTFDGKPRNSRDKQLINMSLNKDVIANIETVSNTNTHVSFKENEKFLGGAHVGTSFDGEKAQSLQVVNSAVLIGLTKVSAGEFNFVLHELFTAYGAGEHARNRGASEGSFAMGRNTGDYEAGKDLAKKYAPQYPEKRMASPDNIFHKDFNWIILNPYGTPIQSFPGGKVHSKTGEVRWN